MKNILRLLLILFTVVLTISSSSKRTEELNKRINFKIEGTKSKNLFVTIGIGSRPGMGACCTGVSVNSTVSFIGLEGDVVYDGKTKRVITKIYKELEGKTIDLCDYY